MTHQYRSVLHFEKYIVKDITYKTNEAYTEHNEVSLDFDFDAHIQLSEDNQEMEVELGVSIFKDSIEKNYPFEMAVNVKGFFYLEIGNERIDTFEANAIAILFPYVRAIVSTFTANANVAPVILPPMNLYNYLKNKHNKKKNQD